jgi:hypothetical protein
MERRCGKKVSPLRAKFFQKQARSDILTHSLAAPRIDDLNSENISSH